MFKLLIVLTRFTYRLTFCVGSLNVIFIMNKMATFCPKLVSDGHTFPQKSAIYYNNLQQICPPMDPLTFRSTYRKRALNYSPISLDAFLEEFPQTAFITDWACFHPAFYWAPLYFKLTLKKQ